MIKFRFARDAFKYLLKEYKIKEIYVPYYLCDVMRHSAVEAGAKPIFYHIDDNFLPDRDFPKDSFILYPNYFGICDKNVDFLVSKYPNLIVDNAHAFFAKPKGFASFNSAKKFLPVKEGAYLWIKGVEKFDYKNINNDLIKGRRKEFLYYHNKLKNSNLLNIDVNNDSIPFCYPYLAEDKTKADEIVEVLETKGKTIYRYWNRLPKTYNEYKFFERLVPIPLDK